MAPTSKSTTPPTDEVENYDFDGWTQEREDAALKELNDVKYVVVESDFVGRFVDGTIVRIPLKISKETVDELDKEFDAPVDQFEHLIRIFVGDEVAAKVAKFGMLPQVILAEKYFRCLQRAQQLAFPES